MVFFVLEVVCSMQITFFMPFCYRNRENAAQKNNYYDSMNRVILSF